MTQNLESHQDKMPGSFLSSECLSSCEPWLVSTVFLWPFKKGVQTSHSWTPATDCLDDFSSLQTVQKICQTSTTPVYLWIPLVSHSPLNNSRVITAWFKSAFCFRNLRIYLIFSSFTVALKHTCSSSNWLQESTHVLLTSGSECQLNFKLGLQSELSCKPPSFQFHQKLLM